MAAHVGQELPPPPESKRERPHVLLLCSPCMGHLIPFTELARRLVADHGFAATILFAAATSVPSEEYLSIAASVPDGVDLVALPAPPPRDDDTPVRERAVHAIVSSIPCVRDVALSLASPLVALVVDMVGVPARAVAAELGVPCYMFFTSPWMLLSLLLHLPELDAGFVGEYRDATEPIRLPGGGCVPIHADELPPSMLADRASETYAGFLSMAKDVARVDGILVSTFRELEPAVVDGVTAAKLPVHAVGPLIWTRPVDVNVGGVNHHRESQRVIRWLDQQPRESVVYVSFGSGGTLTRRQTTELALALEMTQRRFIWAVKRPDEDASSSGAFFGRTRGDADDEGDADAFGFLPSGFVERTTTTSTGGGGGAVGLLLRSWAPQTAILGHPAVGCFVTHCGWNSALESIQSGVPMVAWPLYAEQKMNAAMLEVQARVAFRVKKGPGELVVGKEEVAAAIRRVMADAGMRKRVAELRDGAARALSTDGGSSALALAQVMDLWRSK